MNYDAIIAIGAALTMVISVAILIVAIIPLVRSLVDSRMVAELSEKVAHLEDQKKQDEVISDQVANVLYDLFNLITFLKAYVELKEENVGVSEKLFEGANDLLYFIEKHFAELGLFSGDAVRRKSVQQALAAKYGDMRTLEIMKELMESPLGSDDSGLANAYSSIRRRLLNVEGHEASAWTGRPSGGAF